MNELKTALQLATPEELEQITHILFERRFNPLDYWQTPEPLEVQSQNWHDWIDSLDQRFRYLAADGMTVLRGDSQQLSYREILMQVCLYLKIPYSQDMKTIDIEAEIFLNLVGKAWQKLPRKEKRSLTAKINQSLSQSEPPETLPISLQHDPLKVLLQGSSIVAISSILKPWLLKHIAKQFALHFAKYQAARTALIKGGTTTALTLQSKFLMQGAKKGMAVTAARYGAVRTVFSLIGPAMWGWFIADLGWKTISTNYSRIVPTIFTVAQIRLTRGEYLTLAAS
ncbi:hypothetical protein Xen7305DRAFT_00037130 [Xenococcus sp. PCC 7305]|uniref:YaaW family protein n=1 Tax=Xenococcus sp. PCC 7305 TaxID=102125 RepID=UPI0002ACB804|nr:YaaW family protein [Xenococcus sp. PCC 7305]ELS03985.1 hypothetical protein Xen7305DRAFT_00037130 [Xenococcus sp. PCC 7305]